MAVIGFVASKPQSLTVKACKELGANRLMVNKQGLSSVYKGNKLLGFCNAHPEYLTKELGWSL